MPQNNLTTISECQKTDKIQQETVKENAVAQSKDKAPSKKEKLQWIKNWDEKKYNIYFAQAYGLYHLIILSILSDNTYYDSWDNRRYSIIESIWNQCDWYIPVQFIVPYVIYFGIKHFVVYKKGKLENKET